jgi:guanine nucleotide-binding protein subunit alpha
MRLIYTKDGFTKNEKEEWRVIIFNNILDGLRMTIEAMGDYHVAFEYENTSVSSTLEPRGLCHAVILHCALANVCFQAHLPTIMQEKDLRPYEPIPVEYLRAFKDMWKDPGLQKVIERGNEYALHDNLA